MPSLIPYSQYGKSRIEDIRQTPKKIHGLSSKPRNFWYGDVALDWLQNENYIDFNVLNTKWQQIFKIKWVQVSNDTSDEH